MCVREREERLVGRFGPDVAGMLERLDGLLWRFEICFSRRLGMVGGKGLNGVMECSGDKVNLCTEKSECIFYYQ